MFWTSRFCIPLLLSWDFWVRPCMHTASFLDLQGDSCDSCDPSLIHILTLWNIFWNICTAFLCCSVTLCCSGTLHFLQQHLINVRLLLAMLFLAGSLDSQPWLSSLWVLGSQSLAVSLSYSRPFGTCFIHYYFNANFSLRTKLSTHPWNQLSSDVTDFRNTQASRENTNHHLPRSTGTSTTLSMY